MVGYSRRIMILAFVMSTNIVVSNMSVNASTSSSAAKTNNQTLNAGVQKTRVTRTANASAKATWGQRHPKLKAAAVGGGIGAAAGGATGLLTGGGVVRGAAIGAGTGAGVNVLRKTQVAKRHPIASDAATGAAVGLGLGMISRREHMSAEGALLGGAAGLGVGLWKNRKNL